MSVATMGAECYPTPRPSSDRTRPATKTTSPRQLPTVAVQVHSDKPQSDAAHAADVAAAAISLHTPSASADMSQGVPELPADVTNILQAINRETFAQTGIRSRAITGVDLATWDALKEDHVDALDCRLEYWSESKTLVVTYASGVHESFNFLFKPIARVADGIPGVFVETNHDILLPSNSSFTPDFAFAENDVETKYHIIFECAWSQPEEDLAEKIKKYFTREDIFAVVSLCIRSADKYERPKRSAPSGYQIIPAADVEAAREGLLSPVIMDGHTWGPEINAISLTIYRRSGEPQVFENLCPVAGQFTDDQIVKHYEINKVLLNLLSQAVTPPALVKALGTGKFALDWQEFVQMLDVYQRTDAYTRYLKWGRNPILKRLREEDVGTAAVEILDQATILQLLGPPPLKKPKVE